MKGIVRSSKCIEDSTTAKKLEGMTILCFHQETGEIAEDEPDQFNVSDIESLQSIAESSTKGPFRSTNINLDFENFSPVRCKSLIQGFSTSFREMNHATSKSLMMGTIQDCINFEIENRNQLSHETISTKALEKPQMLEEVTVSFTALTEQNYGGSIYLGNISGRDVSGSPFGKAEITLNYGSHQSVKCKSLLIGIDMTLSEFNEIRIKSLLSGIF